jgi:large subunit ribosomal protein L3
MTIGLVGVKKGMTRIFTEDGQSLPVTVIEATPNRITQLKSVDTDGYTAIQVTAGTRKSSHVTKPKAGIFAKAGVDAGRGLWEFRIEEDAEFSVGGELTVELFNEGEKVDVTGTSKGKGFQGGIKRWNFTMQDATHGNSISHRSNGSIGQNQSPGRVFKGKKMSGHMGSRKTTTQTLEVVRIDIERNLLLIKGAVPGAPGGDVIVRAAVKTAGKG